MSPEPISAVVVTDRAAWVRRMLAGIRSLPVDSAEEFTAHPRTVAAAESYLRRALEALLEVMKLSGRGRVHVTAIHVRDAASPHLPSPQPLQELPHRHNLNPVFRHASPRFQAHHDAPPHRRLIFAKRHQPLQVRGGNPRR